MNGISNITERRKVMYNKKFEMKNHKEKIKMKNLTIITIIIFISVSMMNSQNSRVSWSSFNMGYTSSSWTNTTVKSIVGHSFVGSMKFGNNFVESGFLVDTLFRSMIVDVKNQEQLPTFYSLWQNYPNPFNPRTNICYQLPDRCHVSLKVFDLLGREVVTLVDNFEEPGYKKVEFNADYLSSGMYFYRIDVRQLGEGQKEIFTSTKKLLLLR